MGGNSVVLHYPTLEIQNYRSLYIYFSSSDNLQKTTDLPAGISARRPEISLRASAQREVESAIMLTLYPMSLKYSDSVIPAKANLVSMHYSCGVNLQTITKGE